MVDFSLYFICLLFYIIVFVCSFMLSPVHSAHFLLFHLCIKNVEFPICFLNISTIFLLLGPFSVPSSFFYNPPVLYIHLLQLVLPNPSALMSPICSSLIPIEVWVSPTSIHQLGKCCNFSIPSKKKLWKKYLNEVVKLTLYSMSKLSHRPYWLETAERSNFI